MPAEVLEEPTKSNNSEKKTTFNTLFLVAGSIAVAMSAVLYSSYPLLCYADILSSPFKPVDVYDVT